MDSDLVLRVLRLASETDTRDGLWWRCDGGFAPLSLFACCPTVLERGVSDCVRITTVNVDRFEAALTDVGAVTNGDFTFGPALFVWRERGARPAADGYPSDVRVHALFDGCGPEHAGVVTFQELAASAVPVAEPVVPCHTTEALVRQAAAGGPDHCGLCGQCAPEPGEVLA